jgi:hypothetical protein
MNVVCSLVILRLCLVRERKVFKYHSIFVTIVISF